jgi:hypothetical protein
VDETCGQLHAHLETAGASKKAKAEKEKETDAVVVRVHGDLLAVNPAKVKGNRESAGDGRFFRGGLSDRYAPGIGQDAFQIYTFHVNSMS